MALPKLEPIRDEDLPAFCEFLHAHLNPSHPADVWADAFRQNWGERQSLRESFASKSLDTH